MSAWPELRESLTVRSGHATGDVVRCSLTDTMLADLPVSVVFFYAQAPESALLAKGLAAALDHLPVFAGRLRTEGDALDIVCDDSGVPMAVYDVDETLGEAMARVTLPGSGYVDHVDARAAREGELPLLTVRATRLSDGGMALGCSWHHAVGDMQSFMVLMRAWSAAVEGTALPETYVVQDREAYLDDVLPAEDSGRPGFRLPDKEEAARLGREFEVALRSNRTVQVYFTDAEVARVRAEFTEAAGRWLSTNDVLCAHVLDVVRGLDGDQETRHLAMPANVRRSLGLPHDVVGNLVSEVFLPCPGGRGPAEVATAIRGAVEDFARSHLSLRANRAFVESIGRDRMADCIPIGFDPSARTFTITNWSRFGVYDIAFGGQRPAFFSPTSHLGLPWVAWLVEGFDNTGILCTVALPATLAGRLKGASGRAALHRYRDPDETLPELAQSVRKLI